jgi:iron-sulfur cluster assembly accessory protein
MIDLKPAAAAKLQSIITEKGLVGYGLRVFVSGGSCCGMEYGLGFDKAREGDTVETVDGLEILVDSGSAGYLDGATVDFVDEEGGGFRIESPKATEAGGCNCGDGERKGGCCG